MQRPTFWTDRRRHGLRRSALVWSVVAVCGASWLQAAEPNLEKTDAAPPESVSAEIREALGPDALQVTTDGKSLADFWLRPEVPIAETASTELGVSFGQLRQGTLLGVVRLGEPWSDYKDKPIPAGVYTLRYGIQPADGDHMGVAIYRDYVVLVPVADDTTVDVDWSAKLLWEKSTAATRTPHPAVLALFPIWDELSEPGLVRNEMEQWTLAVPVGSVSPTVGFVIEGHGEI